MNIAQKKGYMHRLIAAIDKHPEILKRGEVIIPRIAHSHNCRFHIKKDCNCVPDITIAVPSGMYSIEHDGRCKLIPNNQSN